MAKVLKWADLWIASCNCEFAIGAGCGHHLLLKSSALEVNGAEEEEDTGVGRVLSPQLHTMSFGALVVTRLVLAVRQFCQTLEGGRDCSIHLLDSSRPFASVHYRIDIV